MENTYSIIEAQLPITNSAPPADRDFLVLDENGVVIDQIIGLCRKQWIIIASFALLQSLAGCDPWPSVEYDFSRLGHAPLDRVIADDNLHPTSEPITLPYTPQASDAPLPPKHHLVRTISNLASAANEGTLAQRKSNVERLGAVCAPSPEDVCSYQGVVIAKFYADGAVTRMTNIDYRVVFDMGVKPTNIEVFVQRTTKDKQ